MPTPRKTLGRGLSALLPAPRFANLSDDYFMCRLSEIDADPDQPRQTFEPQALAELVQSIKEKGILQPLVVRRDGERFRVVAGERRLRAATAAGLDEVPVLVKDVASEEALELALIENIQREDLNPIEEARAYQRLLQRPQMTQDVIARRVGKQRSTVTNAIRLLRLQPELQQHIVDGALSAGHARTLLSVDDPTDRAELARRVIEDGLSVRATEHATRDLKRPEPRTRKAAPVHPLQPYCDAVAEELQTHLGTAVRVKVRGRKGRIEIAFEGIEQLRSLRDALAETR